MKEIKEFPGYFVTKSGRIFSKHKTGKLHEMVLKTDKDGYKEVGLYQNRKRHFKRVHRLVAQSYIPNPCNLSQVNHIDGNKANNHVSNLEWCTLRENIKHSFKVLHRKPVVITKKVKLINIKTNEFLKFNSSKECAKYLNMTPCHFSRLMTGTRDIKKSRKLKGFIVQYEV